MLLSRIYPSSGKVELCIVYKYEGAAVVALRFEFAERTVAAELAGHSSGKLCRKVGMVGDLRENLEGRVVLGSPLVAELSAELSIWDANP